VGDVPKSNDVISRGGGEDVGSGRVEEDLSDFPINDPREGNNRQQRSALFPPSRLPPTISSTPPKRRPRKKRERMIEGMWMRRTFLQHSSSPPAPNP